MGPLPFPVPSAASPDSRYCNVLVEGTTFMEMFALERGHCLFAEGELPLALEGWHVLDDRIEQFDAPGGTVKRFRTSIARRPVSGMRAP